MIINSDSKPNPDQTRIHLGLWILIRISIQDGKNDSLNKNKKLWKCFEKIDIFSGEPEDNPWEKLQELCSCIFL